MMVMRLKTSRMVARENLWFEINNVVIGLRSSEIHINSNFIDFPNLNYKAR